MSIHYKLICAIITITLYLHSVSVSAARTSCSILEVSDENFTSVITQIQTIKNLNELYLTLNHRGGDYAYSMYLAKMIHDKKIPVYVSAGSHCDNDCSALYLASPMGYSDVPIFFPKYSKTERDKINGLSPELFYPIINVASVMQFFSNIISEDLLTLLEQASYDPKMELSKFFNINHTDKRQLLNALSLCQKLPPISEQPNKLINPTR